MWANKKLFFKFSCLVLGSIVLYGCGKAYFPIELKTVSRSERLKGQAIEVVNLLPMTKKSVQRANKSNYDRYVIEGGDLDNPAKVIPASVAIKESLPKYETPGPYLLGPGDKLLFSQIFSDGRNLPTLISRPITVSDDGYINIYEIGKIKAQGLTQSELEDAILEKLFKGGSGANFELELIEFNSKKIYIYGDNFAPRTVPYTNKPIFFQDLISEAGVDIIRGFDARITLFRGDKKYVFSLISSLKNLEKKHRMFPEDKLYVEPLVFRPERVLIVGETGAQRSVLIDAFERPSLSDTIFTGSVLNNITSDFSQVYVLRRQSNKEFSAYHLDITNPARINIATDFEMRPDDIVFVAPQPLTIYSRALQQILGSYSITAQARDSLKSELN